MTTLLVHDHNQKYRVHKKAYSSIGLIISAHTIDRSYQYQFKNVRVTFCDICRLCIPKFRLVWVIQTAHIKTNWRNLYKKVILLVHKIDICSTLCIYCAIMCSYACLEEFNRLNFRKCFNVMFWLTLIHLDRRNMKYPLDLTMVHTEYTIEESFNIYIVTGNYVRYLLRYHSEYIKSFLWRLFSKSVQS